ncbi:unnamed protein product [Paramecium octaurelia]|uniref:Egg coat matrix protein n=1 Tax=Paramecium octaurelia TaxID=43137 RepID=A0A8S1W8N5_PAROT|nr:unnamed protein product [Paramecium octaurelia]
MKTIIIVVFLIAFCLGQRLDINSDSCRKYLQKFGAADVPDGYGATKLSSSGDVKFVTGSNDVQVNLRYSDFDLFYDTTYFGLVQEDGKPASDTCLDLKLWKFTSNSYSDPIQVTDIPIIASNNFTKRWRYYTFIIPGKELGTRLVQTSNSNQFIYKGFYAIAYYVTGTDDVQYTFFFEFSVIVDRATGTSVDTVFKPLTQTATIDCLPNQICQIKTDSIIKWCTDLACDEYATPDLHFYDNFVLQQVVTTAGMNFYLTQTEVWYTGDGILKKAKIIVVDNSVKGQVIIQLRAEIVWSSVKFKVSSTLSTTQAGARRLWTDQTFYDDVIGYTEEIECIKAEGAKECPDCEQQCDAQGYANYDCSACLSSIIIAFIFVLLIVA